jgi:hypothetical protein
MREAVTSFEFAKKIFGTKREFDPITITEGFKSLAKRRTSEPGETNSGEPIMMTKCREVVASFEPAKKIFGTKRDFDSLNYIRGEFSRS